MTLLSLIITLLLVIIAAGAGLIIGYGCGLESGWDNGYCDAVNDWEPEREDRP